MDKYTIEKYCSSKIQRYDIINFISDKIKAVDYLEIGVFNGDCIRMVNIFNKDGVDPGSELGYTISEINYKMTSDEFFSNHINKKYDIIFIDGLHHSEQVDKDIKNSLEYLKEVGYILLHDCNPPEYFLQIVPRVGNDAWNGDVWKSIVKLRCEREDLEIFTIDTDWGVGVIKKGKQDIYVKDSIDECLKYEYFDIHRDELLNIISVDEFKKKIK